MLFQLTDLADVIYYEHLYLYAVSATYTELGLAAHAP